MSVDQRAVQLIRKDADQYVLTDEGQALLATVDEPVAVVSVAGVYRSGKSTLLSLLAKSKTFEVSGSSQACTMGLYCAPTLIDHHGKKILLVRVQPSAPRRAPLTRVAAVAG